MKNILTQVFWGHSELYQQSLDSAVQAVHTSPKSVSAQNKSYANTSNRNLKLGHKKIEASGAYRYTISICRGLIRTGVDF